MRIARLLLAALLLFSASHMAHAKRNLPDSIVLSPEVLYQTKKRILQRDPALMPAYEKLIREADRAVNSPAEAVVLKTAPGPSGDLHDYWSLSPYWWPNPDTPDGLPAIHRNGKRNPEVDSDTYDRSRMHRMARDALTLALAFYLTGSEEYAGKATALVWSWCNDSVTRTNPNMNYARVRPGSATGHHTGIIETSDLIRVVDAARILEPSAAWSAVVTRKFTAWLTQYTDWLMASEFGHQEAAMDTHHGTWFDAQVAVYAYYVGNTQLARSIVGTAERRRIVRQIEKDGSMPFELSRPDSRRDTLCNLEAFFVLASVAERLHIDLWNWTSPTGQSIKGALDFVAPYIDPKKDWPHGQTDPFKPLDYTPLFHRAALVYDAPGYLEFLKALPADQRKTDRANLFH